MRTVRGTAEINSWGGYEKQYQIRIDPDRLIKHGLTFGEVVEAAHRNNFNVGGGNISQESGMLLVQGLGRRQASTKSGRSSSRPRRRVPMRISDVADVVIGHEIRRGAVTANGQGEVVLGLGFMLMGENSHAVTWAMKDKLKSIEASLPPNVQVKPVYDRTELVGFRHRHGAEESVRGRAAGRCRLFAFLGNMRAALIVAVAIPVSMLFAFMGMLRFGIAASLLSLGAIDFGMIVDSSVVMIENCVRHLADDANRGKSRLEIIRDAAVEVRKPTMFGELIIMIVYLPILTLEGIEGKMFRPMALTVIFALAGSMVLSLTLMPVLASFFLPKQIEEREPLLMRHRPCDSLSDSAIRHAPQTGGDGICRHGFDFGVWLDRSESRLGVRAAIVGRSHCHRRRAAGRNRSGRIDPLQHRNGTGDPRHVSRRSRERLEPGRHGRSRHRSDGRRTDRHLHHAQAAIAVEKGPHAGRVHRVARQELCATCRASDWPIRSRSKCGSMKWCRAFEPTWA